MTLRELKEQLDKLDKEIKEVEEKELLERQRSVYEKIESMSEEDKHIILSYMKHDRTSCSDKEHWNGYYDDEHRWRCSKCMLMEILNGEHGGRFDFSFSVDIWEV